MTIDFCRAEQLRCAADYEDAGARLGMNDWFAEEYLMDMEKIKPYYEHAGITIYHGDCREILPHLPKVDLVLTDPPYMINTKSDGNGKLSPWADYVNAALWYQAWIGSCRERLNHHGALWSFLNWRSLVTFQKVACDLCWPIESLLVWDKCWIGPGGRKGLRPSYELVALWAMPEFAITDRGLSDIQRWQWSSTKPNGHPAEKPLEAMEWIIKKSEKELILDCFMGSGTSLVAAKRLGCRAIGIEMDEVWCEIAAKRLAQEVLW